MSAFAPSRVFKQRGFSLLEFAVVCFLGFILYWLAIVRVLPLFGQAEAAMLINNEGAMRAALGTSVAKQVIKHGLDGLPSLAGSNPMALMKVKPPGYRGEYNRVDARKLPDGTWAFDKKRGVLIYRVSYAQYFSGHPINPARVEWQVVVIYRAGAEEKPENIQSVELRTLGQPDWSFTAQVLP